MRTVAFAHLPRYHFGRHDRIIIDEVPYCYVAEDKRGHVLRRTNTESLVEVFTHEQIAELFHSARLRYDRDYYASSTATTRMTAGAARLSDLPVDEQCDILWKQAFCDGFLRLCAKGEAKKTEDSANAVIEQLHREIDKAEARRGKKKRAGAKRESRDPPSARTLLGWVRRYLAHDCDPLALRDRYDRCGNRTDRLTADEAALLHSEVRKFASGNRPSKKTIIQNVIAAFATANDVRAAKGLPSLQTPSGKAVLRAIKRLDPFSVACARLGVEAAKRQFGITGLGLLVVRPMQRVEIDEWEIDLQTLAISLGVWEELDPEARKQIQPVRRWLSVALDTATRCVVAMHLTERSTAESALATLHMITRDKGIYADAVGSLSSWHQGAGVETIVTDAGSGYIDNRFRAAVADLKATFELPPAGVPRLRGRVERLFGTVAISLMSRFEGRTFSNVVQKGDYPAEEKANLTDDDIGAALIRYFVDVYHNTPHEGLGGETPRNAWDRLEKKYGLPPPPDTHTRRSIFGIPLTRTITNKGVRVLGLFYTSEAIAHHFLHNHDRTVEVRLDPEDMGCISVKMNGRWTAVSCRVRDFDGVSLQTWLRAATDLRRRYRDQANLVRPIVTKAIREIQAIGDTARQRAAIGPSIPTEATIARAERDLFLGFEVEDEQRGNDASAAADSIFAESIPVPEVERPSPLAAPQDTAARPKRNWIIKD